MNIKQKASDRKKKLISQGKERVKNYVKKEKAYLSRNMDPRTKEGAQNLGGMVSGFAGGVGKVVGKVGVGVTKNITRAVGPGVKRGIGRTPRAYSWEGREVTKNQFNLLTKQKSIADRNRNTNWRVPKAVVDWEKKRDLPSVSQAKTELKAGMAGKSGGMYSYKNPRKFNTSYGTAGGGNYMVPGGTSRMHPLQSKLMKKSFLFKQEKRRSGY